MADAKSKPATAANPDPDDDGDDDSTAKGDTDHDYTGPDGKRVAKPAKAKGTKMSEETTEAAQQAAQQAAMTEMVRNAATQLGEAHTLMQTMREENAATKRELAEVKIDASMTALKESRVVEVKGDDGAVTRAKTLGFAPAVIDSAKKFMLDNLALREPVLDLLKLIQTTGMVPLSEMGVGASGDDHDPFTPVTLSDDEDGSKTLTLAQAKAQSMGLNWGTMTPDEKTGIVLLVEPKLAKVAR